MKFLPLILIFLFLTPVIQASQLEDAVVPLKEPTIENAKTVLGNLDGLIAGGDARTVTLGKKMHRSVKRIFTKEHKMHEGKKLADEREAKAKQYEKNGRKWLKPNVHGRVNKVAASAAFRDARELRKESGWAHEAHSKEWKEEVEDYERMLGDLQFSKEEEALLVLAEVLSAIVQRTPWVKRPSLQYDASRIQFLRNRAAQSARWLTLANHAADAEDYELSYDFYRQAGSELGRLRVGARLASRLEGDGFVGSAMNIWERLGEMDRVENLQKENPELSEASFKLLSSGALDRNVAPACVRVLTPRGHQTGFFYRQGGHLLTCKWGLLDKEGQPMTLTVLLEDGRKFPATVAGLSESHDIAALKIEHSGHETLPIGDRKDLKTGLLLTLYGFADRAKNTADSARGTVLSKMDNWNNQPTSRLALDGSRGHRGAPLVDQRGRVLGLFLASKTGTARSLEAGAIESFLKGL